MVGHLMKSISLCCAFSGEARCSITTLGSSGQIKTLEVPLHVTDQTSFNTWFRENFSKEIEKYCKDLSYITELSKKHDCWALDDNERYTGLRPHSLLVKVDLHAEHIHPYCIGNLIGPHRKKLVKENGEYVWKPADREEGCSRDMDELLSDMAKKIKEYKVYFPSEMMSLEILCMERILRNPKIKSQKDLQELNLPSSIVKDSDLPETETEVNECSIM